MPIGVGWFWDDDYDDILWPPVAITSFVSFTQHTYMNSAIFNIHSFKLNHPWLVMMLGGTVCAHRQGHWRHRRCLTLMNSEGVLMDGMEHSQFQCRHSLRVSGQIHLRPGCQRKVNPPEESDSLILHTLKFYSQRNFHFSPFYCFCASILFWLDCIVQFQLK